MKEFNKLQHVFDKHLFLQKERDFVPIMIATIIANWMDNECVWIQFIAPPSSGKSKIVGALSKSKEVECVSLLTPNSLISGAKKKDTEDGKEPSLLPRLDGKNMLIKDASTITDMHPAYRSQVFSQLRAAYDGELEKDTGLGRKTFSSKFGIIIAGTPELENIRTMDANLGARFIIFRPSFDENDRDKIWNKIKSGGHVKTVNKILGEATVQFLETCGCPDHVEYPDAIRTLASKLVYLRAGVSRDWKTSHIDYPVLQVEQPWRVAKQLSGLYTGLKFILDDKVKAINAIKRVVRHTIPYPRLMTLSYISKKKSAGITDIYTNVKVSKPTAKRWLEELCILGVLDKEKVGDRNMYSINGYFKSIFNLRAMS